MQTKVKTKSEVAAIKESGKMLASVLNVLVSRSEVGMTTKDLAQVAATELRVLGGQPTFLGYQGFPDVLCVSINNEVVHGIPSRQKILREGDILSLDFGVTYRGMITDSALTFIVGCPKSNRHAELVRNTQQALYVGIKSTRAEVRTGDIGSAIESFLTKYKYGIVRDLVGHGVGHHLHEDPNIPNYGRANSGPWLKKGMTIAIEPMATLGGDDVAVADDGWTILTSDNSMSAHFEHTVLITETGAEILTLNDLDNTL